MNEAFSSYINHFSGTLLGGECECVTCQKAKVNGRSLKTLLADVYSVR
jgi:hypothetical protein